MESSSIEDIKGLLEGIIKDIEGRIKLIRIADKTEGSLATVEEYQTSDLAEDSDDDNARENCNTSPHLHVVTWAIVTLFPPYNTPRGQTAEPNDLCFRYGSKGHFRRDCRVRIPIGIQPGGTRIQAVQQPVQWGWGTGVFFLAARCCTFHTDTKCKKHNSLKLSTMFHRMILTMCVLYLSLNIKNNQTMIITLKAY